MKKFKYAIWDFDGTIADSMSVWTQAASYYLRGKGINASSELDSLVRPKGLMETVLCMKAHFELSETAEQIFEEICLQVGEAYKHNIQVKAGVAEVLEELAQKKVRMCIATASTREHVWAALERWDLSKYFEFLLNCDEIGVGKQSPQIYMEAAKRFDAAPREIMVFEDAIHAVTSAHQAGFFVIGIYEPCFADCEAAIRAQCDLFLKNFNEWFCLQ